MCVCLYKWSYGCSDSKEFEHLIRWWVSSLGFSWQSFVIVFLMFLRSRPIDCGIMGVKLTRMKMYHISVVDRKIVRRSVSMIFSPIEQLFFNLSWNWVNFFTVYPVQNLHQVELTWSLPSLVKHYRSEIQLNLLFDS